MLKLALRQGVERLTVTRVDPEYLLPRGGANAAARKINALIVGAGAVGCWVSQLLAASGVGRLGIVDSDVLSCDNVHRHLLGMESVGINKAEALVSRLRQQFPHQDFWFRAADCVEVLSGSGLDVAAFDFIVLATGDETLELRVSAALRQRVALAHVWLDPFDLGFHVFVGGKNRSGCYRCIFARDEVVGLYNRASFLEKGQKVTRTLGGCSGNFAAYSVQHALSAAMALAEMVVAGEMSTGPCLLSKFCSDASTLAFGFQMSARRDLFKTGEVQRVAHFGDGLCRACSV